MRRRRVECGPFEYAWSVSVASVRVSFSGAALLLCGACSGPQSALDARGADAAQIAGLWWVLFGVATAVYVVVVVLLLGIIVRRAVTPIARPATRYRDANGVGVLTPFEGRYRDYARRNGVLIPMAAEVAWLLPEGRFPYWRGRPVEIACGHGAAGIGATTPGPPGHATCMVRCKAFTVQTSSLP